jgi:tRNA-dihydrouridine synthase 1
MIHSRLYQEHGGNNKYQDKIFTTGEGDRPLIAQFCGNDPDVMLRACTMIQDKVDAVDLNLGCPQGIAKRGHYGSFLLDDWNSTDNIVRIVRTLYDNLTVPITVKIRLVTPLSATIRFAKQLQHAGCAILTVHGRTRLQKGQKITPADLDMIRQIKEAVQIPVYANGGTETYADVCRVMEETGVDGVMSAEGLLANPAIFSDTKEPYNGILMAKEYLQHCAKPGHAADNCQMKAHFFKFLFHELPIFTDVRSLLAVIKQPDQYQGILDKLEERVANATPEETVRYTATQKTWYQRHMYKRKQKADKLAAAAAAADTNNNNDDNNSDPRVTGQKRKLAELQQQ